MGWETSETKLECGCVKKTRTHDFFMDKEVHWYYCDKHFDRTEYFKKMTKEEYEIYYELNKDRLNANRRQRYQENPEKKRERAREYREKNYEKVREREREREREQRRLYPEICRAKQREFYQKNKEKIDAKRCENFECGCGGKYQRKHKAKHEKTQKHLQWVEKKKLIEEEKWCKIEPLI